MKKFRRNFLKLLVIKTIFLFNIPNLLDIKNKKKLKKLKYRKHIWYLNIYDI
tara:strand:- start:117 stop:272 length:156 start_codon:yes stop_codon:yes gene_type:complete